MEISQYLEEVSTALIGRSRTSMIVARAKGLLGSDYDVAVANLFNKVVKSQLPAVVGAAFGAANPRTVPAVVVQRFPPAEAASWIREGVQSAVANLTTLRLLAMLLTPAIAHQFLEQLSSVFGEDAVARMLNRCDAYLNTAIAAGRAAATRRLR